MKKFITLCFASFATLIATAQQPMATLDHNDTITVYYGANALVNAYNASVNGDIITLSPGTFNGITTTHDSITIRGAGISYDTVTGLENTKVGTTYLLHAHNTIEGVWFIDRFYGYDHYNQIIKCRFNHVSRVSSSYSGYNSFDYEYRQCLIEDLDISICRSARFYNCVIKVNTAEGSLSYNNHFINCFIEFPVYANSANNYAQFYNCILSASASYQECAYNSESFNCIGISRNPYSCFWGANSNSLINRSFSNTFLNFSGEIIIGVSDLHLTPEAQTFLGIDSTQVGIYGGFYPYDPRVDAVPPIIGRVTVPSHSNAAGRLDVNVEIINAQ